MSETICYTYRTIKYICKNKRKNSSTSNSSQKFLNKNFILMIEERKIFNNLNNNYPIISFNKLKRSF